MKEFWNPQCNLCFMIHDFFFMIYTYFIWLFVIFLLHSVYSFNFLLSFDGIQYHYTIFRVKIHYYCYYFVYILSRISSTQTYQRVPRLNLPRIISPINSSTLTRQYCISLRCPYQKKSVHTQNSHRNMSSVCHTLI